MDIKCTLSVYIKRSLSLYNLKGRLSGLKRGMGGCYKKLCSYNREISLLTFSIIALNTKFIHDIYDLIGNISFFIHIYNPVYEFCPLVVYQAPYSLKHLKIPVIIPVFRIVFFLLINHLVISP